MKSPLIDQKVSEVARRSHRQLILESVSMGMLCMCGLAMFPILFLRIFQGPVPASLFWSIEIGGSIVGILGGLLPALLRPCSKRKAAREIDRVFQLQSRVLTSWQLLSMADLNELETLQLSDTEKRIASLEMSQIVPLRFPNTFRLTLLILLLFVPFSIVLEQQEREPSFIAPPSASESIGDLFHREKSIAADLKDLAKKNPTCEPLRDLSERMNTFIASTTRSETTRKDLFRAVSDLDTLFQESVRQLENRSVRAAFEQTMTLLDSVLGNDFSRSIREEDFQKASAMMDRWSQECSPEKRKLLADSLASSERKWDASSARKTSTAVRQLTEGIRRSDESLCRDGVRALLDLSKSFREQKALARELSKKRARLEIAKSQRIESESVSKERSSNSIRDERTNMGEGRAGSDQAGSERSGSIQTEGTLAPIEKKKKEFLPGLDSVGPTVSERVPLEPKAERAQRSPQEIRIELRRALEQALDTESIPLGQREIVRRYFNALIVDLEQNNDPRKGPSGK